ncbi:T7SS effector LXG polymorphic toxin [Bacillus carboniphilus]|uniref:T7SS effector LXG polymorphic toxin n=1 Tax=Bacillus carboniphilus TaxID=86663 RepID=A0ABY9JQ80_9BACI|nr:T7SS effector LXG polymorphic toxin [Bacillus carboniphilus]WLR41559.1 T7SS effector LXG polymorphic toxin [Bacillus carboniphilus]
MENLIYERDSLVSASQSRMHEYENLKEQFEEVKKAMLSLVEMDEFQGKGASAIKGFYQAQSEVINAWLGLIDRQIAFLKGIDGDTEEAGLGGETTVYVPFLEDELSKSIKQSKEMVHQQQDDISTILSSVSDLVDIDVYSTDRFEEAMENADKERKETIEAVEQLNQNLLNEYQQSEINQGFVVQLYSALIDATTKGGNVSPIHFNLKAFKESDVYQLRDDVQKATDEYVTLKDQQAEYRQLQAAVEAEKNKPLYLKMVDGFKNFTGELTGYYDYKRATEGVDPITGRELSTAERVKAGGMALAGFIPIAGWGGRLGKGGLGALKTFKGVSAATHALDAYKGAKSFDVLYKTEMGIYGLVTANGFGEYLTGQDMFGNPLTDAQRQDSLHGALLGLTIGTAAHSLNRQASGQTLFPYSKAYVGQKVTQSQQALSKLRSNIGQLRVPVGVEAQQLATSAGKVTNFKLNTKTLSDVKQQVMMKAEGVGAKGNKIKELNEVSYGDHFTKGKRGRKELAPNVRYVTQDGYKYTTDELGRIIDVEADNLILQEADRNLGMQRAAGRENRLPDDDGGHLIGSQFHGSGDIDNLVAQNSQINRSGGQWYKMESEWADALKEIPPRKVSVKIEPIYIENSLRPDSFEIVYKIEGKGIFEKIIKNKSGG